MEEPTVSPLALMDERSPEAWLGQFLQILEMGGATRYHTIGGASKDEELKTRLDEVWRAAAQEEPLRLLDAGQAERLKEQDWAAWWRGQEALTRYCYSALALALLGDRARIEEVAAMYRQEANSRIHKDAHYVLCHLLGRDWPGYAPTEADVGRLAGGGAAPGG